MKLFQLFHVCKTIPRMSVKININLVNMYTKRKNVRSTCIACTYKWYIKHWCISAV